MRNPTNEEPEQVQEPAEESLWLVDVARLCTHIVDNKNQASKGLKKIVDDT
jgi:hypothetical protein